MIRTVHLPPAPLEPSPLDIRWPLGLPLDLRLDLKTYKGEDIDITDYDAQIVLFPKSRGGQHAYDMRIYDAVNGILQIELPGSDLVDESGYGFEVYARQPSEVEGNPPIPVSMPVKGSIVLYGSAYSSTGPQSAVAMPVVQGPPGPAGPEGPEGDPGAPGAPGQRGTMWFTGTGDPTLTEPLVFGDMYLDEASGNVWTWEGSAWARK